MGMNLMPRMNLMIGLGMIMRHLMLCRLCSLWLMLGMLCIGCCILCIGQCLCSSSCLLGSLSSICSTESTSLICMLYSCLWLWNKLNMKYCMLYIRVLMAKDMCLQDKMNSQHRKYLSNMISQLPKFYNLYIQLRWSNKQYI